jgi:hypothetical protein
MDEYNKYVTFIDIKLKGIIGASTSIRPTDKVSDRIIRILDYFFNKDTRRYVFMFPGERDSCVDITVRDMQEYMSTCVSLYYTITVDRNHEYYIKIVDTKSKTGICKRTDPYEPAPVKRQMNFVLDDILPGEIATKISSNVYRNFPKI